MPDERVTDLSPLQAFRAQYWKDRESWAIRDLHEYLVMFPGDDVAVAREYLTLGGDLRAWTGAEPGVAASDWNETDQMLGPYQLRGEVGRGGSRYTCHERGRRRPGRNETERAARVREWSGLGCWDAHRTRVLVGALGAASWGQVDGLTWVPYPPPLAVAIP